MQGSGNDYVFMLADDLPPGVELARLAVLVADRHYGVGGDGLVVIEHSGTTGADARMRIFNADGSEAELCGNALLCTLRLLFARGWVGEPSASIETRAGLHAACGEVIQGQVGRAWVEIGRPAPATAAVVNLVASVELAGRTWPFVPLAVGNPHAVVFVEPGASVARATVARAIAASPLFPSGANVEFVEPVETDRVRLRVIERGSGETLACGTGACAAAAAAYLTGRTGPRVTVEMLGGTVEVRWEDPPARDEVLRRVEWPGAGGPLWFEGPCVEVFRGEVAWPTCAARSAAMQGELVVAGNGASGTPGGQHGGSDGEARRDQ